MMLFSTGLGQVTVTYKSSDEVLRNPERGFYTELTSQAEQSPLTPSSWRKSKRTETLRVSIGWSPKQGRQPARSWAGSGLG